MRRLSGQVSLILFKFYMWGNSRSWREYMGRGKEGRGSGTSVMSKLVTLTGRGALARVSCAMLIFGCRERERESERDLDRYIYI